MNCPKCGFEIQEIGASACPKCGVVFAKLERTLAERAALEHRMAAERSISAVLEKQMEADENVRSGLGGYSDLESVRDEEAYPLARFLSSAFTFLAALTAMGDLVGLTHFYQWGRAIFAPRDMYLFLASLVIASFGSVIVLLAIAEGLRMGRDVTNHTRAMREYLRKIAVK